MPAPTAHSGYSNRPTTVFFRRRAPGFQSGHSRFNIPRNGSKLKRASWRPCGTATARNITLARGIGAGAAIQFRDPPRMPDVVQHDVAAALGQRRFDDNVGVRIGHDPRAALAARSPHGCGGSASPPAARSRENRPPASRRRAISFEKSARIAQVGAQDARQRARVFIDEGVLGARDKGHVARLQILVDLLDRHAGRDEAQPKRSARGER